MVIPAIDLRAGRVVRLVRGRREAELAYSDDPAATAAAFVAEGAAWLHVVDLDAAFGEGDNRAVVRDLLSWGGARLQVGGGVRSADRVDMLVRDGAARIVLGTAAIEDPSFVRAVTNRHGDRIAVGLDVDGEEVRVRGWTEGAGPLDAVIDALVEAGARRFVVTQITRDGTLDGPDVELFRRVVALARRPVVASGGVRHAEDVRAAAATGVEGLIVGRALYDGTLRLSEALEAAR